MRAGTIGPQFVRSATAGAVRRAIRHGDERLEPLTGGAHRILVVVLVVLLSADLVLISTDLVWGSLELMGTVDERPDLVQLNDEDSVSERFNFAKWVVATIALLTIRRERHVWVPVALVTLLFLLDDVLRFHERSGGSFEKRLGGGDSDMMSALGEVAFFVVLGLVVFSLLVRSRRRAAPDVRPLITRFIVLVVVLAGFGVGVDFVHAIQRTVLDVEGLHFGLYVLEDGGELVMISLIAAHAVRSHLAFRQQATAATSE